MLVLYKECALEYATLRGHICKHLKVGLGLITVLIISNHLMMIIETSCYVLSDREAPVLYKIMQREQDSLENLTFVIQKYDVDGITYEMNRVVDVITQRETFLVVYLRSVQSIGDGGSEEYEARHTGDVETKTAVTDENIIADVMSLLLR